MQSADTGPRDHRQLIAAFALTASALAVAALGWSLRDVGLHVLTYEFQPMELGRVGLSAVPWLATIAILIASAVWIARRGTPVRLVSSAIASAVAVLAAVINLGHPSYALCALLVAAVSVTLGGVGQWNPVLPSEQAASDFSASAASKSARRAGTVLLGVVVLAATGWYTMIQYTAWSHFGLGVADFGLYTRDLESCLPWSHITDRFRDTRLGYHFEPLFFALTPLYAVFRSPVLLMVLGPLAMNATALVVCRLALERGCSLAAALLCGLAWLALPSLSQMPHGGSYGFESVHLAVPLVALTISAGVRGRWRASHIWLILAVLVQETLVGFALGWAAYLLLFTKRRIDGVVIAVGALAYFALATEVVIPIFAATGAYSRLELIGASSLLQATAQLTRPRAVYYALALAAPLAFGLARGWRLLIIAAPALLLVLAMANPDYLCIRYWHQSSILPALFAAAVVGITGANSAYAEATHRGSRGSIRAAAGTLAAVLIWHAILGFSPLSQSYRLVRAVGMWSEPDPRTVAVEFVHDRYPPESSSVYATQRAAAHFLDYRAIAPLTDIVAADAPWSADVIVIDERDTWDGLIGGGWLPEVLEKTTAGGYREVYAAASMHVFAR